MAFQLARLAPTGRIKRKTYWVGSLLLLAIELPVMLAPGYVAAEVVYVLLLYPWIWLYARRLHDLGFSGWVQLPFYVIAIPSVLAGWSVAYLEVIEGAAAAQALEERQMASIFAMTMFGFEAVANLAFFLWLGIARGQPRQNRYGPQPGVAPVEDVFS